MYLHSVYISGYGDVLPEHPNFFLLSCVYTFLGLALVSMTITVIGEFMEEKIEQAKEKIEEAKEQAVAKIQRVSFTHTLKLLTHTFTN